MVGRRKEVTDQAAKVATLHRKLMLAAAKGDPIKTKAALKEYREAKGALKQRARGWHP